jgi:hypothetical protein
MAADFGATSGDSRIATHPDGSKSYSGVFTVNGTILELSQEYDAQNRPTSPLKSSIAFTDASEYGMAMLEMATGGRRTNGIDHAGRYPNGLKIAFGPDDWMKWRDAAKDYQKRFPMSYMSPIVTQFAAVKDANHFARTFFTLASGPYTRTFEDVFKLAQGQDAAGKFKINPLPGTLTPGCPGGAKPGTDGNAAAKAVANAAAARWCGINVALDKDTKAPGTSAVPVAAGAGSAGLRR